MVTSEYRPEVEIWPFHACGMKNVPCKRYYRNSSVIVDLLWGRYHIAQNLFPVVVCDYHYGAHYRLTRDWLLVSVVRTDDTQTCFRFVIRWGENHGLYQVDVNLIRLVIGSAWSNSHVWLAGHHSCLTTNNGHNIQVAVDEDDQWWWRRKTWCTNPGHYTLKMHASALIAYSMTLTLHLWPWNLFCIAHSHNEYLC